MVRTWSTDLEIWLEQERIFKKEFIQQVSMIKRTEDLSGAINIFILLSKKKKKELGLKALCKLKICIRKLWCNYDAN